MDSFFESPKHTVTTALNQSTAQSLIKTEYADLSDLIGSQTQLKLISVQPTSSINPNISSNSSILNHNQTNINNSSLNNTNNPSNSEDSVINNSNLSQSPVVSVLTIDTANILHNDSQNSIKDSSPSPNSPNSLQLNCSLSLNNVSTHTFRKTEWDVKKLENYVRNAYSDNTPMEAMRPTLLNRYLKSFFELAKKSDGMDYEPESLIGFMNSFERYLKTKNYPESLLRSETFKESRTILKKKRDLVRSIGKLIRTKTKDTCYLLQFHRNLLKEKNLLSRDNPDCLLAEIYLNNMIYFGEYLKEDKAWRGNLNLVWGDMLLERDPQNGLEYLTLATYAKKSSRHQQFQTGVVKLNGRSKTGTQLSKLKSNTISLTNTTSTISAQNVDTTPSQSPRVYAQRQPLSWCPIEAYKMYRSRRPSNCLDRDSPFYLAPLFKSKNQSKVWYKALAMSCQRLDALFYCLFKKAGVDLTSLASMSQQQQATAAAAVGNNTNTNNTGWSIKQNSDNDDDESMLDKNTNNNTTTFNSNMIQTSTTNSTNAFTYQQHHAIVPAQIQVQVQIQVPIQNSQQQTIATTIANIDNSNGNATSSNVQQARLYLLSPSSSTQNNTSTTYTILDHNCV